MNIFVNQLIFELKMKKPSFQAGILFIGLLCLSLFQSCYYDNEEDLYPSPPPCDTVNVSYADAVWPVISSSCTSCHSGIGAGGGVQLSNHTEIADAAINGRLLGVIRHDAGFSPMPKDAAQLSDCNIKKLEAWAADGAPDN